MPTGNRPKRKTATKSTQPDTGENPQASSSAADEYVITGEQLQQLRQLLGGIVQTGSVFDPDPVKMYGGMIQSNRTLATQAADVLQKLRPVT
ncbi:hypothetical protein [Microbulbifer discodermiae]|uniref:hypothetical protein n=1 Tax=Microbulbifer sp. 2201CG32-9 TaxID=3232309 RepID=UPI00345BC5FA